jgi:hypothetical protein
MSMKLETRDGRLAGTPASRVDIHCVHGTSHYFILPGRHRATSLAAIELLRRRHAHRHGCGCAESGSETRRPN